MEIGNVGLHDLVRFHQPIWEHNPRNDGWGVLGFPYRGISIK